jgi:outer membrane immunogenic protein
VKKFLLAGIAFGALAVPAMAADMPVKALPPAPIDIWTGGYVGANVGYGWGSDRVDSLGSPGQCSSPAAGCVAFPNLFSNLSAQLATFQTSVDRSGLIYGGQAGHNWLIRGIFASDRLGTWDGVFGVEVDFQGLSDSRSTSVSGNIVPPPFPLEPFTQTATLSEKLTTLGTARSRAGLLWGPNTLIYATGGVAWASTQFTSTIFQNHVAPGVGPYTGSGTANTEVFGPVVGGGVEWKWTANWSVKAEYLYADLGHVTINTSPLVSPLAGLVFSQANVQTQTHVHENIARVGVNYKFW